jgi:quercetin dioxygenase-like cupin family protein
MSFRSGSWLATLAFLLLAISPRTSSQGVASGICKPVSERSKDIGCWILADSPIGALMKSPVFWHLDVYSTRAAAEEDKGPTSTIIEAQGKAWLMTIEAQNGHPRHGERVGNIGPLEVNAGENYSAQYMEVVFMPGMTSLAHLHGGPEAWYMLSGEGCLETSDGKIHFARSGGPPMIVPAGLKMFLTTTGKEQRRAIALILHETSKPATTQVQDWKPKGLCNK